MAIDKGATGEQVFRTVFTAWGQYFDAAQPAVGTPESNFGSAGTR